MLLIQEGLAPIGQHKGPSKNRPKPVSNRLCFQSLEIPEKEGSKGKSTPAEGPPAPTARPSVAKARLNFLSSGLFEGQRRADQQFSLARLNRASPLVPFPSGPLGLPLLARSGRA